MKFSDFYFIFISNIGHTLMKFKQVLYKHLHLNAVSITNLFDHFFISDSCLQLLHILHDIR